MLNRKIFFEAQRRKKLCAAVVTLMLLEHYENMPQRSVWVKKWVARRKEKGVHHNLFLELALEDPNMYRRCLRMDVMTFEYLLQKVTPLISKQDTHLRESIPAAERLSLTLRHLATGESQASLSLTFRLGKSTISGIVKETCSALITVLKEDHLKFPSSEQEWKVVAYDYGERWNFYNCIGAMDGKHCRIDPPLCSGSLYYNYKDTFSIVLMAVVDAQLRFLFVDVGTNGGISDSGIWNKCALKQRLEEKAINVPAPAPLPGTESAFPFVIVGDEGFPLSENVLIPYPKTHCTNRKDRRIYNYRLSRARRCSENAFGVLGARFQIFRSPMRYDPDDARNVVLTCCILHNMLRSQVVGRAMYTPPAFIDAEDEVSGVVRGGDWRNEQAIGLVNIHHQGGNRHGNAALQLRENWCEYFNGIGAVPWQDRMVH